MGLSKKILLDTNFLMVPGLFGVDVIEKINQVCDFSYVLCVLDKTKKELSDIIKKQSGKDKTSAKIASQMIEKYKLETIDTSDDDGYVDDLLVKYGKKNIVATNDINLIKRLKEKNISVLRLRQKKYVVIEQ